MDGFGDAVSLPVDQALLAHLDLAPALFTPNGDGVNDALQISFDVLKVIDARPIAARVYDLHGRLVRTLNDAAGVAGTAVSLHPGVVQTELFRNVLGGEEDAEGLEKGTLTTEDMMSMLGPLKRRAAEAASRQQQQQQEAAGQGYY